MIPTLEDKTYAHWHSFLFHLSSTFGLHTNVTIPFKHNNALSDGQHRTLVLIAHIKTHIAHVWF